ncbi:MAG: LytR C-terminal domain-containing protein [Actinomycetes bacterium]
MFTPIGMGGHKSRRRRHRRRWPAVLLVAALVAGGGAGGWWYLLREPDVSVAEPSCPRVTPTAAAMLAPKQVQLNVYNATQRLGLAATVAKRMTARGYAVKKIDNDPLERAVSGAAEIRYGEKGLAEARTVQALAGTAEMVKDARTTATVDLVLGDKWRRLAAKPVAPKVTPEPRPGCGPDAGNPADTAEARTD